MDFEFNSDQALLATSLDSLLSPYATMPAEGRSKHAHYDESLDAELEQAGMFGIVAMEDMGAIAGAIVAERIARLPSLVEAAASIFLPPALGLDPVRPLAVINGPFDRAHRNLPVARTALIDLGDDIAVVDIDPTNVQAVESIMAYPYGRFIVPPDLGAAHKLGADAVPILRQWARVALACEMAGATRSAVDFVVQYTKDRQLFGKALGTYQSVQHRLAECHQISRGLYYLTMRAAWSGLAMDADVAACYAQQHVQKFVFDLHQFNGGMGMTNENLLHFWTYRMRALQSELGGANGAALAIADHQWGVAA